MRYRIFYSRLTAFFFRPLFFFLLDFLFFGGPASKPLTGLLTGLSNFIPIAIAAIPPTPITVGNSHFLFFCQNPSLLVGDALEAVEAVVLAVEFIVVDAAAGKLE